MACLSAGSVHSCRISSARLHAVECICFPFAEVKYRENEMRCTRGSHQPLPSHESPMPAMIACMQAQQYRGGGDAAHEVLLFSVGTSAAAAGHGVPPLPSGNLVSGLAAAVLSHSQVGCSCLAGWQLSHLLLRVMDLQVTCEPDACAPQPLAQQLCAALPFASSGSWPSVKCM